MSRYIDADTLKVSITKYGELHISHKKLPVVKNEAKELIRDICFAIDANSTADVVPVVHGHWIKIGSQDSIRNMKCSICGEEVFGDVDTEKYCFNCGSKMDAPTQSNDSNVLDALGEKVTK